MLVKEYVGTIEHPQNHRSREEGGEEALDDLLEEEGQDAPGDGLVEVVFALEEVVVVVVAAARGVRVVVEFVGSF